MELQTERLLLREWKESDWPPFAQLNASPDVMRYFPATLTEPESNAMADRLSALVLEQGWGFWAVELCKSKRFIGFVGLHRPTYKLPVSSCVEIGWRLAKANWGNGYATEAARRVLDFAFKELKLAQVYSFTTVTNQKSKAVMRRLHLVDTHCNFAHPLVPESSPLREHVLYKIDRQTWLGKYAFQSS